MNYELAKQLKEAGFPQEGTQEGSGGEQIPNDERTDVVYRPTLPELIEACGAPFHLKTDGGFWYASRNGVYGDGSKDSPTEAVANLYLELNK